MDGIRFILGIHAHQPVGNLPEVFAEAHRRWYVPFLESLSEFPQIPLSLHISGVLFDWLEDAHPDYLDRLAALVARGQVELLTGAYHEPILAAILDPPAWLWRMPVQTISQSEAGYERVARQIALLPHWVLGGQEGVRTLTLTLTLESREAAGG